MLEMPISTPRPASTVVVVRAAVGGSQTFDVLMLRRSDTVAFMAGAYVFPGGGVDDTDYSLARSLRPINGPARFPDLTPDQELPYRLAAVRELQEEAGVHVAIADLVPIAHWVTPEVETRRYDTRFFLVGMPADQEATHDARETTELAWMPPAHAIDRGHRGEIMLPPPTWTTLKRLARFLSTDDLFAWAETTPIVRVQPAVVRDERSAMLTLPGDPTYPTIAGWEVPEETRFVLENGQWRPART